MLPFLSGSQPLSIAPAEAPLYSVLLKAAKDFTLSTSTPLGVSLAVCFDLLVTAEYARRVANNGWLYCPTDPPMLLYPFVNACPRCVLSEKFVFHKSNKPESGAIGTVTSNILCKLLLHTFTSSGRSLSVYKGREPVDIIIADEAASLYLVAEVKAAPLITFPLATPVGSMTGLSIDGDPTAVDHTQTLNPLLTDHVHLFIPGASGDCVLYPLGRKDDSNHYWSYDAMATLFDSTPEAFHVIATFWQRAFSAYGSLYGSKKNVTIDPAFWFTNACGQPSPRPFDWPTRQKGVGGFESISDVKSSVGMDRTDDIKKGIYQVLKIGTEHKATRPATVCTALISNIHAVRHYDEYLGGLQDVIWTFDPLPDGDVFSSPRFASDLDPETPLYNLFDGIVSLTKSHTRDPWINELFSF